MPPPFAPVRGEFPRPATQLLPAMKAPCYTLAVNTAWVNCPEDLIPALYLLTCSPGRPPSDDLERRLEHAFLALLLANEEARTQIQRVDRAFRERGPSGLLIKGSARILRMPDCPLPRRMTDLDIVVPRDQIEPAMAALRHLGYEPEPWNSPEDRLLQALEGPGLRHMAAGLLDVDLQARLPGVRHADAALGDALSRSRPAFGGSGDRGLLLLDTLHELILEAAHLTVHTKPPLTASPKWITDLLLLIHHAATGSAPEAPLVVRSPDGQALPPWTHLVWPFRMEPGRTASGHGCAGLNWAEVWETARRWGVEAEVASAITALARYWPLEVDGLPPNCPPLDIESIARGSAPSALLSAAVVPSAYGKRIARMRSLPNMRARLRYLVRLAFPEPAALRFRYRLGDKAWLPPHYVAHLLRTTWKLVRGCAAALLAPFATNRGRR